MEDCSTDSARLALSTPKMVHSMPDCTSQIRGLFVTCEQESAFADFGKKHVASRATLYLESEPVLLDRFIAEMEALAAGTKSEAYLEVI